MCWEGKRYIDIPTSIVVKEVPDKYDAASIDMNRYLLIIVEQFVSDSCDKLGKIHHVHSWIVCIIFK